MEFKNDIIVETGDFWYDLFDGGYIKPEELLVNDEEIKKINEAIEIIKNFREELDNKELLSYY